MSPAGAKRSAQTGRSGRKQTPEFGQLVLDPEYAAFEASDECQVPTWPPQLRRQFLVETAASKQERPVSTDGAGARSLSSLCNLNLCHFRLPPR